MQINHPRNSTNFVGITSFGDIKTPSPKKPYMKFISSRGNACFTQDDDSLNKYIKGRSTPTKIKKPALEFETHGSGKHFKHKPQVSVYFYPEGGRNKNEKTVIQVWNPVDKQVKEKLLVVGSHLKSFQALKNARLSK